VEKKIQTKHEVLAELMAEQVALKKNAWGTLTGAWVRHDTRDQIVDFVRRWSEKTEISSKRFVEWLDITASKFYDWRERYGKVNEHNGWVPRDFWLEEWEKQAIIGFYLKNRLPPAVTAFGVGNGPENDLYCLTGAAILYFTLNQHIISRLENFAARVKHGLHETDWTGTLVKRVEVGPTSVNVVFRVDPGVSFQPPEGRVLPDCTWRQRAVKSDEFGLELPAGGRQQLIAFLRTL
jgi:hypothetical protein